ncbi:adenylate/guanylate cyclase domain-containing protein [Hoeflea sp. TYP-13]|uniref:adenylate/guanylate cyclase domain-containing protein n=1 Tax=Hoeflea sp. TYP-13 TaxID=3230023 RepID=UPI0034C5F6A6
MSDNSRKTSHSNWKPAPIIEWMLAEGRLIADIDDFTRQLGERMLAAGAPLWRLRLSMRTLHPLVTATTAVWERESGTTQHIDTPHGLEGRASYIGSPFEIIGRTGAPYRRKLTETLTADDHEVLHELAARGGTDYLGLPMPFSDGAAAILVFTTDITGGFLDRDIVQFEKIASVLAPIAEAYRLKRISLAVTEAYLGQRTGRRVLEGQITRGHIEKINAAILVSDIRDWTGLNNRVAAEEAVTLANRYFEVIATAVESNDGEILKFIGDGVLAIFPTGNDDVDAAPACGRALAAAQQAFHVAGKLDPPLDLDFGMGMHFGEVLYGNVGSQNRIDFTVLGQAVNIAARIEGLCGEHHKPILFSKEFANLLHEPSTLVSKENLKGFETEAEIFSPENADPATG